MPKWHFEEEDEEEEERSRKRTARLSIRLFLLLPFSFCGFLFHSAILFPFPSNPTTSMVPAFGRVKRGVGIDRKVCAEEGREGA
jgi:hypothetical protein